MSATKVTLRKRELPSGKITLYLDFYPPVRNPRTGELSRREYLGIYLSRNPKTPQSAKATTRNYRLPRPSAPSARSPSSKSSSASPTATVAKWTSSSTSRT